MQGDHRSTTRIASPVERSAHVTKYDEMEDADLATLLVDLADGLDGVQVIDTRVKTNLVHNDNTSLLRLLIELSDSRGNVAGSHNVGLAFDGGLNDGGVVGVGDERDDEVVGGNFALEVSGGVNVKGDGARVRKAVDQALGGRERPAGYRTINSSLLRAN